MSSSATMTSTYGTTTTSFDTDVSRHPSFRSQSKLREILRDQSRREEVNQLQSAGNAAAIGGTSSSSSNTSAAIQSLQMAGQQQQQQQPAYDRSRRPSLVSSVSAVVLGTSDIANRQRKDTFPSSKTTSQLSPIDAGNAVTSQQTSIPTQSRHISPPPAATRRQRSLRRKYDREMDSTTTANATATTGGGQGGTNVAEGESITITAPPSRLTRSQSTATNLSGGVDLKVVILGAQGVGKTSLVHRYTSGQFSASAVPSTIGASFLTKKLIVDGIKVRLQLWDTAGQERFRSMAPMYYRGANAAVIVYDITNPYSFEDVKTWIDELRQNVQSDLVIHIVGSKADLAPYARQVDIDDARRAVAEWTNTSSNGVQEDYVTSPITVNAPSNSIFGSRRGLSVTPPSPGNSASATPGARSSPPTSPGNVAAITSPTTGSRLPVLGSFSVLKSSRIVDRQQENEGDRASNPSTASSNGVNGNYVTTVQAQDWDFIEVSEVSAKDNEGIEDVFVGIATRLVERKEELEARAAARRLRERESVFLTEDNAPAGYSNQYNNQVGSSWCCST